MEVEGLIDITPTGREIGEATQRDTRARPVADPQLKEGLTRQRVQIRLCSDFRRRRSLYRPNPAGRV